MPFRLSVRAWAADSFNLMHTHPPKEYHEPEPPRREPKPVKERQINLNTVIGLFLAALIAFVIQKLDTINTATIETKGDVRLLNADVSTVKHQVENLVTKGEMAAELADRDRQIQELKKAIETLRRAGGAPRGP